MNAATTAPTSTGIRAKPCRAIDEHEDIEFTFQIAGVEGLRINELKRKFELLENPTGPAGGHNAAVLVIEADADGLELERFAFRCGGHAMRGYAELFGACVVIVTVPGGGGGGGGGVIVVPTPCALVQPKSPSRPKTIGPLCQL